MPNFFQHRPALKVGLIVAGGIIFADHFNLSVQLTSLTVSFFVFAAILLFLLRRILEVIRHLMPVLLVCTLFALGAWKVALDKTSVMSTPLLSHADTGKNVRLLGEVLDRPQRKPSTFQFVFRVYAIDVGTEMENTEGDLLIYVRRDEASDSIMNELVVGRNMQVYGRVERPKGPRNPGDFDFRHYLLLNGISGVMYVQTNSDLTLAAGHAVSWSLRTAVARVRSGMASTIDETVGGVEGSFLKGILLGDRSEIPTEVKTSFINSGVVHVLAVSGLHVGMVALIFISVFTFLRLRKPWTTLLTIVSLLFYMLLTGSAPSVVRATIMAVTILLAPVMQRRSDVFNSLAFSAIVIFFYDAKQLFNPGFQLSYAAVASILYFYPKVVTFSGYFPNRLRANRFFGYSWKLFSVSCAAQVGTIPFTIAYFGKISIVSFVANLVVIPAVGIGLALGFAVSVFSLFSGWFAGIYGAAEQVLLSLILRFVDLSGNLSFAYISVSSFGVLSFLIFYVIVTLLFNFKEKALRRRLVLALLILGNIAILPSLLEDTPIVRLTVLDVGQGDAILVQFPSGKALMVDAGPKTFSYDAGERIVVPFLKRTVGKLDVLLVTHPHSDHLGGVESILRSIPVETVLDAGHHAESSIYLGYMNALKDLNIPYACVRAGNTISLFQEARVFVLHPTRSFVQKDSLHFVRSFNNSSVVLKILYGKVGILLTGDAEEPSETQMLYLYGEFLKSDLIKVAHHGSTTCSGEFFIKRVKPQFAAISVGALNKFGLPSTEVVERYQLSGARVCRTDEDGALMFETDGITLKRVDWR